MRFIGPSSRARYLVPLVLISGLTLGLRPVTDEIGPATVALTFLLAILVSATFYGRNPALLASFVAMLTYNYFFLPPYFTWHVADTHNLVAWGTFTLTAIVAGELSAYARRRAQEAERGKIEIERLYGELHGAFEKASHAEALRQSEQLKSSLLDAVTHDLRTPLTSIKASVTALLDDRRDRILDPESRTEFLEIINEETDRLNEFIEGMVGLARVEAKAIGLRRSPTSVEEIIRAGAARIRSRLANRELSIEIGDEVPLIEVDANSISEVVFALLDNAIKYSGNSTRIRVSARRIDDSVEIAVEDEGCGIPTEARDKIFGKFFRANGDLHTTGGGLGLGLAIARGIIESQGGSIRVDDGGDGFVTRLAFRVPAGATG